MGDWVTGRLAGTTVLAGVALLLLLLDALVGLGCSTGIWRAGGGDRSVRWEKMQFFLGQFPLLFCGHCRF